jgi:DNA ligase (NAD+)
MTIKERCELFLRYKYEYYILNQTTVSDIYFDKYEAELRATNDPLALAVVDITDFPSLEVIISLGLDVDKIAPEQKVKRDETKYKHWTKMLSITKLQVNDEENIPYKEIDNFLNKKKVDYYECSCKYDGNSMDLLYLDGELSQALTRGDGEQGLDRSKKMKLIVPNRIPMKGRVEIRGEVVVSRKIWKDKYFIEGEVSNERNWVGGAISKEDFNFREINDLVFVAYSLVKMDPLEYVTDTMNVLKSMGFNKNHEPFLRHIKTSADFEKMYFDFKEYRENCEFLLDGIVIKYPENVRLKMPTKTKYPAWSLAVKFESVEVETKIIDIEWTLGKNGDFNAVAILEPVELLGTIVKRANLASLGLIYQKKTYIGAIVSLKKSGEIIPMITGIVEPSEFEKQYDEEIENFIKLRLI